MRYAMRTAVVLALLLSSALASEEPLALRFPDGATAYVEARGLAPLVDQALASPLGAALRSHPAVVAFWASPEGVRARAGLLVVEGATGLDAMGVLRAVGSREVAVAAYGKSLVAIARMDPAAAERLLTGAELLSGKRRVEAVPADAAGPALWQLGNAFVLVDGDLLVLSTDQLLATAVRGRTAKGLGSAEAYRAARALVAEDALVFATVDLRPFRAGLEAGRRPKDLGQALIAGAFAHYVPDAPWMAVGIDVRPADGGWSLAARGWVPVPGEPEEAVASAYGGTLADLPFALPARTVGLVRLRRDLASVWSHRDELIAEAGLPGLVEFETNFGNLTGGMSWVEEFLPLLGDEMVFLGTRREYGAERAPAIRYPQGALLVPLGGDEELRTKLKVAYFSTVGIVNIQQGQMKGRPLVPAVETYQGVEMHVSRYMAPTEAEMEGGAKLPVRYNLAPSMAMVDGWLVLATTDGILKEIVDGRGGATPAPRGVNAGVWLRPAELRTLLAENREPLVAQRMLEQGEDRGAAEKAVDLGIELARVLRSFSLTVEESQGSLGLALDVALGPAAE